MTDHATTMPSIASRNRFRRRAASASLICGLVVPTAMLAAGLYSNEMAARVNTMSAVLLAIAGQAVPILIMYMKFGSDETQAATKDAP